MKQRKHIPSGLVQEGMHFVEGVCRLYGGCLEWEDCLMEGWKGFVFAFHSYPAHEGSYEFWEYAFFCVRDHVLLAKREYNRCKRPKSGFSLDYIPPDRDEPAIGRLAAVQGDFVNSVMLRDYLSHLGFREKRVAWAYINRYTDAEIMDYYQLDRQSLTDIRRCLRVKMEQYQAS